MSTPPHSDDARELFAESTIEATIWLICHPCRNGADPERLRRWLDRHPPGRELLRIARSRIRNLEGVPG